MIITVLTQLLFKLKFLPKNSKKYENFFVSGDHKPLVNQAEI